MEHLETKQNDNGRSLACIEVGETWVEAEFQGQGRRSGIAICGTSSGGRTVPERAMLGDSGREGRRHTEFNLATLGCIAND
jgi:hypothetical protein